MEGLCLTVLALPNRRCSVRVRPATQISQIMAWGATRRLWAADAVAFFVRRRGGTCRSADRSKTVAALRLDENSLLLVLGE